LRRGYEVARGQERQNGDRNMNKDNTNYNNWSNPWGQAGPMMEQWTAAIRMWTDAWSAFMPGGRPPGWGPQGPAYAPFTGAPGFTGYGAGPGVPPMSVAVTSRRPVEVIVNLKPGTSTRNLSADSFVPSLPDSVALEQKDGRLLVSVTIAEKQASGRYTGVIRSADTSIAGDVTVVISEVAQPAQSTGY
jgi:hypothetical protein